MTPPPRLARRLVERVVATHLAEAVLGDLEELFAVEARTSLRLARVAYWRRAIAATWHLRGRPAPPPVARGDSVMHTLWKDVIHGLRLFVTQPAYTWAAVVTLGLAIGANTVIFSIANVLVVKPLPFVAESSLGWILVSGPNASQDRAGVSLPEYAAYRDEVAAFSQLGAWRRDLVTLRAGAEAERALAQLVIGDLQRIWGLAAVRGRALDASDERSGAPKVAMLSHRFWTRRFGQAADSVGSDVFVDGQRHTVVGVVTPEIELGNMAEIDVWVPYDRDPRLASRVVRGWRPVGRLRDGATRSDANAQVAAIGARLGREFPDTSRDWTARVGTTREAMGGTNTWLVLTLLAVVVGLLLVLACANVMNLLIARLIGRRQELAVRTALGATRGRVIRQIVSESLVLGLAGGLLGLAIAALGLRGVHAVATEPFFDQITIDWRVVLFALGLAVVAPLVFAVVPTIRVLGHDIRTALNDATARSVGGASGRGRAALVLVQVALAVMLMVVSTLVVRSMQHFVDADLGYDPTPLLTAEIEVPAWKVSDDTAALRLRQRLVERARAIPGVEAVATVTAIPALDFPARSFIEVVGREAATDRDRPSAGLIVVSPDYFRVVALPIVAGRAFTAADAAGGHAVTIVSQETARRYWGDAATAIGGLIRVAAPADGPALEATVVGVARDAANPLTMLAAEPMVVLLDEHRPMRSTHLVVRGPGAASLGPALRAALRDAEPDLPFRLRTVVERFADENSSNQLLSGLFAAFAVVALLLATAGLYGVVSYAVSQRTPEIAVRMALGASRREIARDVVGSSLRLTVIGAVAGLVGALALAQTMTSLLFGVSATDGATYAGAAAVAIAAALVAAWIPMRRAAAIDPIQSLRQA